MTTDTERAYVPAHGRDDAAIQLGLLWTTSVAQRILSPATLLIPTWRQLDSLLSLFRPETHQTVVRNRAFLLESVPFRVQTFNTRDIQAVPTLVLWADDERLAKLDDATLPAICVVPWNRDGIGKWVKSWGPLNLRDNKPASAVTVKDPVVEVALRSLSSRVDTGRGLDHPSDKDASVGMLRLLRDGGHAYTSEEIRAWCLQNGWGERSTSQLEDWAQRVLDRRSLRTRDSGWTTDILALWREEARGSHDGLGDTAT